MFPIMMVGLRLDSSTVSRSEPDMHQHHPCTQRRLGPGGDHQFRPPTPDAMIQPLQAPASVSLVFYLPRRCASYRTLSPSSSRLGLCSPLAFRILASFYYMFNVNAHGFYRGSCS
jgi:hypothetical protein